VVYRSPKFGWALVCCLTACCVSQAAQQEQNADLDRQFQSAAADYDAGRFREAASRLEKLLPYAAKSFEVHELLGLVYAAESHFAKAEEQLEFALRLKPNAADVRTNLAATLAQEGRPELAIEQLRKAVELEPGDYNANHDLGELYIQSGKIAEARPFLEAAHRTQPDSYDNGYDLAMADFLLGQFDDARQVAQSLAEKRNTGEVQNLLGHIDEKEGKFVPAANEFEAAAHMDPSEDNLFDWGSEMLLHRTYEPAITIFKQGTLRYSKSPRLFIGLGLALYSRGHYDDAVKALLTAADLNPSDPHCYLFLSKAYDSSPKQADAVIQAFRHYADLRPSDARAQYFLAISLWKGNREQGSTAEIKTVESLLQRSIALDGTMPEAHLQLGDLYADGHQYDKSIPEYMRAIELDPNLSDAHYRLGTDYVHVGQKDLAEKEFAIYQKLRAEHLAEVEKERAEVQQFVYSEKGDAPAKF
jgi:tetratricopeptide (TPR) repeat protein